MAQPELAEFYKQLNDLIIIGPIRPTKPVVSDHQRVGEKHQANTSIEVGTQRQAYDQHMFTQKYHPDG